MIEYMINQMRDLLNMSKMIARVCLLSVVTLVVQIGVRAQVVTPLVEVKVADNGLYFDGPARNSNDLDVDGPGFDFYFGRRITPHGDCLKRFGDFVFMSWWAGGEENKHVMLSRYNLKTNVMETIEFPHTHVGFRHQYKHIGDSHNTIAVGICPLDSTVHLLYDMHSYSKNDFPDSYFNYNVSLAGAALAKDGEFSIDLFGEKQTYLNQIYDYSDITYPNFFVNNKDELLVWFREGGNNNGQYKFARYNGQIWSSFTEFNVLDAKNKGNSYNWGLYGDMKYINGKLRVGFVKRMNNNSDPYVYNNGYHYGYSNDQNGKTNWFNYKNQPFSIPLISPEALFFFEPASVVESNGANSVTISSGADWTVTDNESIHFITNNIRTTASNERVNVHAYKASGDAEFTVSTDFPGGELYAVRGNLVFLMGLNGGRPYIYMAEGGTNDWRLLYEASDGLQFRHMNVLIEDGQLFLFLMQNSSGSAQPIYLQVYDLGLPEVEVVLSDSRGNDLRDLRVFPNPASSYLEVDYPSATPMTYSISDLSGLSVQTGEVKKGRIDIQSLKSGVYFLQLSNSEIRKIRRFMVH